MERRFDRYEKYDKPDRAEEFGRRRQRRHGGHGGPPPWLAEMFAQGFGQGFGPGFGPGPSGRGRHGGYGGSRGRGRGPRVRRGDVRAAILDVLHHDAEHGSLNGYQVIQTIAERSNGAWKPSPGSVYPTIQQLEDEGLVRTEESGGRKNLLLTDEGRTYVAEHPEELAAVWAPFAEEAGEGGEFSDLHDLKKVIAQAMAAVWQVASTGTSQQVRDAAVVLAETRRKLYTILAEGDGLDETDDASEDPESGDEV